MPKEKQFKIFADFIIGILIIISTAYFLINLFPSLYLKFNYFAEAAPIGDGLLFYATTTNTTMQYRTYASSTNAFGNATNAGNAISTNVRFIVSESSPVSNETITGVWEGAIGTAATLTVKRWTGTAWVDDWTAGGTASSTRRGFDIAYYGNSGNAVIVYATTTVSTGASVLNYRTWNGSIWSATNTLTFVTGTQYPVWVEAEGFATATSNPNIIIGYSDIGGRFGAGVFNGTTGSLNNASTTGTNLTTNSNATRQFDVAFEGASGDGLMVFGFQNKVGLQSKSIGCNQTSCNAWTTNTLLTTTGDADFVDMAASPQTGSNDIAIGATCSVNTTADDTTYATRWTGAAFAGGGEDANTNCNTLQAGTFGLAAGFFGTSDVAFVLHNPGSTAETAGTVGRLTSAAGDGTFTASNITNVTCADTTVARSFQAQTWPNANSAMISVLNNTGLLCNWVTNVNTTGFAPLSPTSSAGSTGFIQAATAGFAAAFNFFRANKAPTLSISQPPGGGASATSGDPYLITYTLNDIDDVTTVAFYYETDGNMSGGTACTGCGSAAEGTGATCSWDTTGVSAGNYYVYGVANDGSNSDVKTLSPGLITITVATSLTLTIDTGNVSFVSAVTPGTPVASSSVLTVNTNNSAGYNITINRASTTSTLFLTGDTNTTIADNPNGNNWTAPATSSQAGPSAIWTVGTTKSFGFRLKQTGTVTNTYSTAWWGTDDTSGNAKYSGISTSTAAQVIANSVWAGSGTNENTVVEYKLDVTTTQKSGSYISSPIIFTATTNP